jgi:hypothetical protein
MEKVLSDKSSYHRRARKAWMAVHGKRPRDDQGARYHTHHIDGDYTNNDIHNLLCVSQRTHREIHCGRSYTMNITDINHVRNNTVIEEIDLMTFSELVDLLVLTMTQLGTELTAENGGRDGWEDLVNLPDDALADDEEFDVIMDKVHSFIWSVAYPVALSQLKP